MSIAKYPYHDFCHDPWGDPDLGPCPVRDSAWQASLPDPSLRSGILLSESPRGREVCPCDAGPGRTARPLDPPYLPAAQRLVKIPGCRGSREDLPCHSGPQWSARLGHCPDSTGKPPSRLDPAWVAKRLDFPPQNFPCQLRPLWLVRPLHFPSSLRNLHCRSDPARLALPLHFPDSLK